MNGQPTLAFRRDNVGNLGQEITARELLSAGFFSYRLIAEPPSLERLSGSKWSDRRAAPALPGDQRQQLCGHYQRSRGHLQWLESDCHTRNDGSPPPAEVNPQQLLGTWQAEGNAGYAFGANNAFKKLERSELHRRASRHRRALGTLLTLTPGDNQRQPFFSIDGG